MIDFVVLSVIGIFFHFNYILFFIQSLLKIDIKEKKDIKKATIVIAARNEEVVIEKTLKKIRKNFKGQIIVADGNSSDSTAEIARKYADKVVVERKPKGKPAALNSVLKYVKNPHIYFLDSDSWVSKKTLDKMLSDGDVAVGLMKPRNYGGITAAMGRLMTSFINIIQISTFNFIGFCFLNGRNFILNKDKLKNIGGFRDKLTEDVDISLRLYERGEKTNLLTDAFIEEQVPVHIRAFFTQQKRWVGGGLELLSFLRKLSLSDRILFSFFLIPRFLIFLVSFLSLPAIFLTPYPWFFAILFAIGFATALMSVSKYLEIRDVLLFPITFISLCIFQTIVSIYTLHCYLTGPIKWEKTEKIND